MQHKLVFIETTDVVETTLALDNFRRACDCGRGAVFFSVARGKVAEVRCMRRKDQVLHTPIVAVQAGLHSA